MNVESNEITYEVFAHLMAKSSEAERGYKVEKEHSLRSAFARDRDRVMYSKEFRRLSGKTQVFVIGFDDNQRTRLTHTLEVSQIARTISDILKFNDVLTEAIAYAHDLGHTPFGHVGERSLNFIMNNCDKLRRHYDIGEEDRGFKHNWQGLKVVCDLEKISKDFDGLNLTKNTLWGILHHSSLEYKRCKYSSNLHCNLLQENALCVKEPDKEGKMFFELSTYEKYGKMIPDNAWTFEALVVRIADEIAQRHHDTEDSLLAGLFTNDEMLKEFEVCFKEYLVDKFKVSFEQLKMNSKEPFFIKHFGSFIIDFLIRHLVIHSKDRLNGLIREFKIVNRNSFLENKENIFKKIGFKGLYKIINYNEEFCKREEKFQDFLWKRILLSNLTQKMDGKSNLIIRRLFKAYISNPQQLPDSTIISLFKKIPKDAYKDYTIGEYRQELNELHYEKSSEVSKVYITALHRTICDFIAGATDGYAISLYNSLYGTSQVFKNTNA